jgi:hypothetical protein
VSVTRTAAQRAALEQLTRLHGERIITHRRLLKPDEVVHGTAVSLFLQMSLEYGPAAGEGILFVTSTGLVWASEQWPGGYRWPKTEIGSAEVRPCPRSWQRQTPSSAATTPADATLTPRGRGREHRDGPDGGSTHHYRRRALPTRRAPRVVASCLARRVGASRRHFRRSAADRH